MAKLYNKREIISVFVGNHNDCLNLILRDKNNNIIYQYNNEKPCPEKEIPQIITVVQTQLSGSMDFINLNGLKDQVETKLTQIILKEKEYDDRNA